MLGLCGIAWAAEETPVAPTPPPAPQAVTAGDTVNVSTDQDHAGEFKPEVVNVTKLGLTVQETPQAMTVIPRAVIDSQGSFTLRDALRNAAGLTIGAGEGGVTGDAFTLRGFNAAGDIYLDGMKDNGQYVRDTFNIEQVEVLKGPSSLLFGRGSVGGAINQVTRKPGDKVAANLAFTGGSNNLLRVSGGIGGPVIADHLGARVDGYILNSDSFRDNIHVDRKGIAPTVRILAGPQDEVTVQSFHQREKSDLDYGLARWKGRPADVDVSTFYGFKDDDFQQFDVDQYTLTYKHAFNEHVSFRNASRYSVNQRYYRVNIPSAASSPNNATAGTVYHTDPSLDTTSISQALRLNTQSGVFNQTDVTATGALGGHEVTFVGGAEFGHESYDFRGRPSVGLRRVSIFSPQQADSWGAGRAEDLSQFQTHTENGATTVAWFGQGVVELVTGLKAVAGIRWDQFDSSSQVGSGVTLGANGLPAVAPATTQFSHRDRAFSPRAGLIYEPVKQATVYASYGTSFSPAVEAISSTVGATTVDTDPEKSRSFEVGSKLSLIDERLLVSLSVFRVEKYNARGAVDPVTGQVTLDGNQRSDGIEGGVAGTITDKWRIFAGGSVMNARFIASDLTTTYIDYDAPTVSGAGIITYPTRTVSQEGNVLTNTPKFGGTLWTTYELPAGFTIGGGFYGVGQRFVNAANTEVVPGYVRTDLTAGWGTRAASVRWNAQINVSNLFNVVYYEASNGNFTPPGTPRTGQLTLSAEF